MPGTSKMEADIPISIPIPIPWDFQTVHERSTRIPVLSVVYHVIEAETTSSENTSFKNASNNVTESYQRNEDLAQIEIAVLATIFALAVVGNVCVLVALGRRRKITSRMHMFIMHLSVADLLVALCNILPQLAWDITGAFQGGDFLCRTVTFLQVFVMYLSTYVLVMTAIDRYRAICYPLSNYNWTPRTVNMMITLVYIVSAVFSIPQPLLFKYQVTNEAGDRDCWANFDPPWLLHVYVLTFTALVYILPFLLLLFTYGSICYTLWAHQPLTTQPYPHSTPNTPTLAKNVLMTSSITMTKDGDGCVTITPNSTPKLKRLNRGLYTSNGSLTSRNGAVRPRAHSVRGFSRAKLKTVKLTFVVILAYLFCWSPFFISHVWWLYDPQQENNSAVVIMVLLSSLNSCCNPWIYLAFSGNLLKHLLPCTWRFCPSAPPINRALLLNTPSHSPQRAIEMLGFPHRAEELNPDANSPGRSVRRQVLCPTDFNATTRKPFPSLRQASLTSLLTLRNTSGSRQQSPPGVQVVHAIVVGSVKNGQASQGGAEDPGHCLSNGCAGRNSRLPAGLMLQTTSREDSAGLVSKDSSSSSSTPRSPHLYKRTRLHERPREEVAEAQLKWEHNMGIRGTSASCFTYGMDTE